VRVIDEERLFGRGDVHRDERMILSSVLYRLTVCRYGSVYGKVRAPRLQGLADLLHRADDWLQLRLADGRVVFFQLRRAESRLGGWGEVEGRLAP
jgi:hypothetical protein